MKLTDEVKKDIHEAFQVLAGAGMPEYALARQLAEHELYRGEGTEDYYLGATYICRVCMSAHSLDSSTGPGEAFDLYLVDLERYLAEEGVMSEYEIALRPEDTKRYLRKVEEARDGYRKALEEIDQIILTVNLSSFESLLTAIGKINGVVVGGLRNSPNHQ